MFTAGVLTHLLSTFDHFPNFYELTVYGQCMYRPLVIFQSNIVK